jgi:hypothetical protein
MSQKESTSTGTSYDFFHPEDLVVRGACVQGILYLADQGCRIVGNGTTS